MDVVGLLGLAACCLLLAFLAGALGGLWIVYKIVAPLAAEIAAEALDGVRRHKEALAEIRRGPARTDGRIIEGRE